VAIQLIIGLGNPGEAYASTRHNAGAWFVSALAQQHKLPWKLDKKCQVQSTLLEHALGQCRLALPIGFMNHSGQAVRAITQFYKIAPEALLVVHDELDLPVGRIKLKHGGGHGGHNGLRDIISQLGADTFYRLRIGIGHPGQSRLVHDYVLSKPLAQERQQMDAAIDRALQVMPLLLQEGVEKAMNQLNQNKIDEGD
jgi:PTH1 family peptidyl-tRNA hydrolase